MKYRINLIIIFFLIIFSFSCKEKALEYIIVDENALIKKLSENNFYRGFFSFNIRPRDEGNIYLVETDSLKEFLVSIKDDKDVKYIDDVDFSNNLRSIYSDRYLEAKKSILLKLKKIIPFMIANGIKASVHVEKTRISFLLTNNTVIEKWCDKSTSTKGTEALKKYYDDVVVVDSNWAIFKHRKI